MKQSKKTNTTVADVLAACHRWAPPELAWEKDNVGLIAGDPAAAVTGVLLSCDLSTPVVVEAAKREANVVIVHHPPIFTPVKSLRADAPRQAALLAAIRGGLHVIAMHTNYDAAAEGVNDVLAALVGLTDVRPLCPLADPAKQVMLVVFTPATDLSAVQRAAFAAGAGQIGEYADCGFRVAGVGSFRGSERSNPTIGQRGRLEEVDEWRLEMIVPEADLAAVLAAVRKAHSYEEPVMDVYPTIATERPHGIVRLGRLARPTTVAALVERIKPALKVETIGVIGPRRRRVKTVAVCSGGCGDDMLAAAIAAGVDLFVTGEMSHDCAVAAVEAGLSCLLAGHWHTERPAMAALAPRLATAFPAVPVHVSRKDAAPISYL